MDHARRDRRARVGYLAGVEGPRLDVRRAPRAAVVAGAVAVAVLAVVLSAGGAPRANDRRLAAPFELAATERAIMVGMNDARTLCADDPSCGGLSLATLQSFQSRREWLPYVDARAPSSTRDVSVAFGPTGTQHPGEAPIVAMAAMSSSGRCVEMAMLNARPFVARYDLRSDPSVCTGDDALTASGEEAQAAGWVFLPTGRSPGRQSRFPSPGPTSSSARSAPSSSDVSIPGPS